MVTILSTIVSIILALVILGVLSPQVGGFCCLALLPFVVAAVVWLRLMIKVS